MTYDPAVTTALKSIDAALAELEILTTHSHSLAGLAAIREVVNVVKGEPPDTDPPPPPPEPEDPDGDPPSERSHWALRVFTMMRLRATASTPSVAMTHTSAKAGAIATY